MTEMQQRNEEHIYKTIKQAILQHKLRPNTRLIEKELAKQFKVSRTPIRNVLRRLAYEKLIKIIPNKGAIVICPSIEESKQILQIREVLEAAAIRQVCRNITEEQIEEIRSVIEEEQEANAKGDLFESLDLSLGFHYKIAELTGNQYYYRYLEELISLVYVIVSFYGSRQVFSGWQDHFKLLDLIKERKEEEAGRFMAEHLREVAEGIFFEEDFSISLGDVFK